MLYVPGNNPGMVKDAHIYRADSVMFDLEDSVSIREKDSARFLVYHALRDLHYERTETVVRINGLDTPFGEEDIQAMVYAGVDIIRLPKTDCAEDVQQAVQLIRRAEEASGREIGITKMFAAIESPKGVVNAYAIATADPRIVGVAFGAEDYVTNLQTERSKEGRELLVARQQILIAARAAGIHAIDTVYSAVNDSEGFRNEVLMIKEMGFNGKSVINPRQIGIVHEVYTPALKEIRNAQMVLQAIESAEAQGSGVASLDGKMIDKPVVERARRTLELAEASGIYLDDESEDV